MAPSARACLALAVALLPAAAAAETYRFRSYTVNEGLASNAVYGIYQDRAGYLWFSTDAGASRYDGAGFRNFGTADGLADMSVRSVLEDGEGGHWIVTKGGLSRWDGRRFETFTGAHGLASEELRCGLASRDGSLWLGTSAGLSRRAGGRFVNYGAEHGLPPGPVWTLHEDRAGTLWVGIRGGGLLRRENGRFAFAAPELRPGQPTENVFDIEEDQDGALWIATDAGLVRLQGGRVRVFTEKDGLPSLRVSSLLRDGRGRLWVGTFGGGVARLEDGGAFTVFDRSKGLPDAYITGMYLDYEGNIWFASLWRGAFLFLGEQFRNYGLESGIGPGLVTGIAQARDGSLWFAMVEGGLTRIDPGGKVRRYGVQDGLLDDRVWALLVDRRDRVWAGGSAGVSVLEGGRFRGFTLADLEAKDRIDVLGEDGSGRIWMASSAARSTGILVHDGRTFERFDVTDGLAHNQVRHVLTDREGVVWISTEGGLSRFDGRSFRTYGPAEGLPTRRVVAAHEDELGRLWVGTSAGLALWDGARFRSWSMNEGLPSNFVTALTSRGGVLWVGTPAGLAVFDGRAFRTYGTKDGLASQQISMNVALRARDGSLWLGTSDGAVRQVPIEAAKAPVAPRLVLTHAASPRRRFDAGPPVELGADERTLTFHYAGLSFRDERAVRYSSLLEGFESEWSVERPERSIRFTNLAPGRYRFLVKARTGDGPWSEPKAMALQLPAPWWATPNFRTAMAAVLLGLGYAGYSLRIRAVKREEERRQAQRLAAQQELLEAIRHVNAGLDLGTVLRSIAVDGALLVGGTPVGIGLVRDGSVVFDKVWQEGGWRETERRERLGEGVAGAVAASGEGRLDPEGMTVAIRDRTGAAVGVLEVGRPAVRPAFSPGDRELVELLAHQAAVAIENASLYGDLQEKRVLLSETVWAMEELWRNEQQMRERVQELDRLKTNFMIVTAHEMRTPLTILKGHADLLLSGAAGEVAEGPRRFLEVLKRNTDRMADAFADIVQMLQVEERRLRLHRRSVGLEPLVREAAEDVRAFLELRRQTLEVDAEPGLPPVLADPDKLHLVVTDLLENAIRFTPDEGRVAVRLRREGPEVRLTVEDSGIGIEAHELERVFDKFYTSMDSLHHKSGTYQFKTRGAGLGLAIVRAFVEAHGGRVWAESAGPGQGSAFHVVLPIELKGLEEA